jgi:hypothetical protein
MGVLTHFMRYNETKNTSFPAHIKKRVRYAVPYEWTVMPRTQSTHRVIVVVPQDSADVARDQLMTS